MRAFITSVFLVLPLAACGQSMDPGQAAQLERAPSNFEMHGTGTCDQGMFSFSATFVSNSRNGGEITVSIDGAGEQVIGAFTPHGYSQGGRYKTATLSGSIQLEAGQETATICSWPSGDRAKGGCFTADVGWCADQIGGGACSTDFMVSALHPSDSCANFDVDIQSKWQNVTVTAPGVDESWSDSVVLPSFDGSYYTFDVQTEDPWWHPPGSAVFKFQSGNCVQELSISCSPGG